MESDTGRTLCGMLTRPLLTDLFLSDPSSPATEGDQAAWRSLSTAQTNVTPDITNSADGALLKRLILEEQELTNDEVRRCLEYIYSHMINKYQGDLAEHLAVREITAWLSENIVGGTIGPDVRFLPGTAIRERRPTSPGDIWCKGADGLFISEGRGADSGALLVAGIIEVKSFSARFEKVRSQVERHAMRLKRGVRIGDGEWTGEQVLAALWDESNGLWRTCPIRDGWRGIFRILVSAKPKNQRKLDSLSDVEVCLHLPVSHRTLADSAYRVAARVLTILGDEVFTAIQSPWPAMTPKEAGENALKEALFHVVQGRELPAHPSMVARRLYNVFCFGHSKSEGHRHMIWQENGELSSGPTPRPPESVSPEATLQERVDAAWWYYRRGLLEEARRWGEAATEIDSEGASSKRVSWLIAMTYYCMADFSSAADHFPAPSQHAPSDSDRWAKDLLTLASIRTRLGLFEEAEQCLELLSSSGVKWDYIPVSIVLSYALIAFYRGDVAMVGELMTDAERLLGARRKELADREEKQLGSPLFHNIDGLLSAALELALLQAARGHFDEAVASFKRIDGIGLPVVRRLSVDPLLISLRDDASYGPRFVAWLSSQDSF